MNALPLLLLAALQDPVRTWSFEDLKDVRTFGRPVLLDSPIGAGGRLLQLNGVDARVEFDNVKPGLSLSLWILPFDSKPAGLLTRGWTLDLAADASVHFNGKGLAPAGALAPGRWHHLVLSFDPDAVTLHIDGARKGSAPVKAGDDGPLLLGRDGAFPNALVDELQAFDGPLSPDRVRTLLRSGLPWLACEADRSVPFAHPADHDVIAVTGGEDAFSALEAGFLEAGLLSAFRKTPLHVRGLAWEGDTVHDQWRIHNFGTWEQQLLRAGATTVLAWFGKSEALQGVEGLPTFIAAYERLLDAFATGTKRLILVSPTPFERLEAPLPDLAVRNADLKRYVDAIRELAAKRAAPFVDLFTPLLGAGERLTRDGIHLSEAGHARAAAELVRQLARTEPGELTALLPLVREKHRLWMSHWRPANWAFLHGDRATQPSSRDHKDPRVRWFPAEVQSFLALVRAQERKIEELLRK